MTTRILLSAHKVQQLIQETTFFKISSKHEASIVKFWYDTDGDV